MGDPQHSLDWWPKRTAAIQKDQTRKKMNNYYINLYNIISNKLHNTLCDLACFKKRLNTLVEAILPIPLKLCAHSPSILSDASMQLPGLAWKALTLMDELCFTSQRHLPSLVCKPMSDICTCLQYASHDRKRLLEIISEMRRQRFDRGEHLQAF